MEKSAQILEKWIKKNVKDVSLKHIQNDNPVKVTDINSNIVFKPYEEKAAVAQR